jgi:ubiquinone/menaquinone biosynthesis C-methylase UbiE
MTDRPTDEGPDRADALRLYQRAAQTYDRRTRALQRYRRRAVERLSLRPGEAVIDVACGSGINFALLQEGIGSAGQIIGIDLSPEMLAHARQRVAQNGWGNVTLIEAAIEDFDIAGLVDAALFSLTHDVLQSPAAVANVLAHLRPGGQVASFGSKSAPPWAAPVNLAVRAIARRYVTTFAGFQRPWLLLEEAVDGLEVESVALGGAYIAWGSVPSNRATAAPSPVG